MVIALHGTGGNKDNIADIVLKAARAGFIGVAIDGRFHGERTKAGSGADEYNQAIADAFKSGEAHPFYYDTTWDVMRLIDYLATRKDVDAKRIGLTGISKGGIETYLAAAADPRIAAAVPYIGVQSFKWSLDNGQWRARIATIQDAFDPSRMRRQDPTTRTSCASSTRAWCRASTASSTVRPCWQLIAPRPLLVVNADSDANTPIAGVRLAVATAKPAYAAANAADKLQLIIAGEHAASREPREHRRRHRLVRALARAVAGSAAPFARKWGVSPLLQEDHGHRLRQRHGLALRRKLAGLRIHAEHRPGFRLPGCSR